MVRAQSGRMFLGAGWHGGAGMLFLFALLSGCVTTTPVAVRQTPEIGAELRCPVCGVHPAEQPRRQCQLIMGDGKQIAFDGGKDMFAYLQLMGQFGYTRKQGLGKDVGEVWVRDYHSGGWLDGKKTWFVAGSDELGPAGKELLAFADRAAAEAFSRGHGGKMVNFELIDGALLKELKE